MCLSLRTAPSSPTAWLGWLLIDQRYSSSVDGLSFNRLNFGVGGYDGPMVFVLRTRDGQTFGAFVGEGVAEAEGFQGNPLSFLFSLRPHFSVLRATPTSNGNFVYVRALHVLS